MLSWLLGLDPNGIEAMGLCAFTCAILIVSIIAGFLIMARQRLPAPRPDGERVELGLLALWRLDRLQRTRARREPVATGQPAETAPR